MSSPPTPTGQPARQQRPVRVWDVVVTLVLLVLSVIFAALASYFGAFLAMASDGCFDDRCNDGLLTFGVYFAMLSPWVWLLLSIGAAIALLVTRRLAFWVPLAGVGLTVVTFFVAVAMVGAAVGG
jgi:membrane protein YdbS with pleckstrin-like domain